MGYVCLLGFLVLIGMLSVSCGLAAGRMSGSTLVASLTSFVIYSGLLFVGCWLLYQSIPPEPVGMPPEVAELNARVLAQAARDVIGIGIIGLVVGGSLSAVVPIVCRRLTRAQASVN